ncbi:MAG: Flp pilus assembly complex ATPase component [Proteobacteria bacterium]|nr:Flp pilus assembly complex ATPase component [Pseudomonadota bacterium]MCP4917902.1 Flp pilus assembly complex ATPase component [Pseudomonadota bacterium]
MDVVKLLRTAVKLGASDLHITSGSPPAVRLNGRIKLLKAPPLRDDECEDIVGQLVTTDQLLLFARDNHLVFGKTWPNLGTFRISIYSRAGTIETSIRASATDGHDFEQLGLPNQLRELTRRRRGLLLITAPMGHGRTTTLHALISAMNQENRRKIVSIEEPIERIIPNDKSLVVQVEVGTDVPDIETGLLAVRQQDADVVVVSELDTPTDVALALELAESGHLVVAALHVPTAQAALRRLIDAFPSDAQPRIRRQMADVLLAVFSQRLVPRADNLGRIIAAELLLVNDGIARQIRDDRIGIVDPTPGLGKAGGMNRMDQVIRRYLREGVITVEAARAAVHDPQSISDLT